LELISGKQMILLTLQPFLVYDRKVKRNKGSF
jgi:hypothetical protein